MWRIENCPTSHKLCESLPDIVTDDAASGTRIHKALETGDTTGLSERELEVWEMCESQTNQLLADWGKENVEFHRELRLGMTNSGIVKATSPKHPSGFTVTGQADLIGVSHNESGRHVIVIDYKTGNGDHEHAVNNAQLRALAVLAGFHWAANEVRVAIVQPWAGKPTVADFSWGGIQRAYEWLNHTLERERNAKAEDTNPGKWCDYCKAKAVCGKWQAQAKRVENTQLVPSDSMLARSMLPEDVAAFDDLCARVMSQAAKGRAWVQALVLQEPDKFRQFYALEQSTGRETIDRLDEVWNRFNAAGIPQKDFLSCLTARKADSAATGMPGFKGVLKRALGLKGKALDEKLDAILEGCTVEGKTKTVAVRLGVALENEG